ncbi:MAG: hypothetical protein M3Y74_14550, partial [Chloroflexota bacterium]|nr:hypothetical protein [Chloroflexota bacterium]
VDNWTDDLRRMLRRHLAVHGAASGAQAGDFYRLTPDTPDLRAWEAWQMHDPSSGSGVLAVWRSGAPEAGLAVHPHGLAPSCTYSVGDLYDPAAGPRMMSGQTLQRGLDVSLPPDGAALYAYQPYEGKGTR